MFGLKRKIKIKKNRHYPFLPIFLPKWVNKNMNTIRKGKFMFTNSCMYKFEGADQHDVNKLFGFSIGFHHKNSFRFGWRPIIHENKIEIVGYEYHDGIRQPTMPICRVYLNKWYDCEIIYNPLIQRTYYIFNKEIMFNDFKIKKRFGLGYTLGIYFGGNRKAPHDIIIYKK